MNKKMLGQVQRIATIILWALSIYLLIFTKFWYPFVFILGLHTVEIFVVGVKKGTAAGKSMLISMIMTLVFGFTWWMYLDVE